MKGKESKKEKKKGKATGEKMKEQTEYQRDKLSKQDKTINVK